MSLSPARRPRGTAPAAQADGEVQRPHRAGGEDAAAGGEVAKLQRFVLAEEERAVFAGHGAAAHGVHADLPAARADKALAAIDGRVRPPRDRWRAEAPWPCRWGRPPCGCGASRRSRRRSRTSAAAAPPAQAPCAARPRRGKSWHRSTTGTRLAAARTRSTCSAVRPVVPRMTAEAASSARASVVSRLPG